MIIVVISEMTFPLAGTFHPMIPSPLQTLINYINFIIKLAHYRTFIISPCQRRFNATPLLKFRSLILLRSAQVHVCLYRVFNSTKSTIKAIFLPTGSSWRWAQAMPRLTVLTLPRATWHVQGQGGTMQGIASSFSWDTGLCNYLHLPVGRAIVSTGPNVLMQSCLLARIHLAKSMLRSAGWWARSVSSWLLTHHQGSILGEDGTTLHTDG